MHEGTIATLYDPWTSREMLEALMDSPILIKAVDEIKSPILLVQPFPVSREMLDRIYG